MAEEITLTVDGRTISAQKGQTVIEAARAAGIYIPYLCWHPTLKAFGACRMCVVEVEGARGTPASCTTDAADGMVVKTNTGLINDIRHDIMDMVLSEHPHGCLTCPRIDHCGPTDICLRHANVVDRCVLCPQNERCELQDVVYHLQMKDSDLPYSYRHVPLITENPFIDHDMNLCIVCGRCVRACNEIEGVDAITFIERGDRTLIGTSLGGTLSDSGCTFCGVCVDVCPVGAITEKDHKWTGAPERSVTTVCSQCSVGCQLELLVKGEKVVRSIADIDGPVNRGQSCAKGKFGYIFVNSDQRLTTPLVRRDGQLVEASWDEALDLLAEKLPLYKGETFGALTATTSTNEENYLFQKFVKWTMDSPNLDHVDRSTESASIEPLREMLGVPAMTNSFTEMVDAKCLLVVGSDMTSDHPVAALQIKEAVRRGASLIVVDPVETELAQLATSWLRPNPGTEASLLAGMIKHIIDEDLLNSDFVSQSCEGLDDLKSSLSGFSLDEIEKKTGVSSDKIVEASKAYSGQDSAAIFYATTHLSPGTGPDVAKALVNLALLTGNLGKPASGVNPLRSDSNSQGTVDVGCVPGASGLGYSRMMEAARNGRVKAMYIVGDSQRTESPIDLEALDNLEFLVVQDMFLTEAASRAHVVLPSASASEKDGTFTNAERRVQRVNRAVDPPGDARSGLEIICDVAVRLGAMSYANLDPAQVMEEIANQAPSYAGVRHDRLGLAGLQVPCPSTDHPGTPILHSDGIARGKGLLSPVTHTPSTAAADSEYPLTIITSMMREIKGVIELNGEIVATLHPEDAAPLGLMDEDQVEIITAGGAVRAKPQVSSNNPKGTVFLLYPHTETLVQTLYNTPAGPTWDPTSLNFARAKAVKLSPVPA